MRVLLLGGTGMLGHKLCQAYRNRFDTWVTVRGSLRGYERFNLFDSERTLTGVDATDFDTVKRALTRVQPHVVINCIGIIKQLPSARDPIPSLTLNSLFPHRLAELCGKMSARLL